MCSGLKRTTEQQRMKKRLQQRRRAVLLRTSRAMDASAQGDRRRERLEGRLNDSRRAA